jgi:hypothetical protein
MRIRTISIPFLVVLIFVQGCAIRTAIRESKFKDAMDSQVGKMTYDDAISIWGKPSESTESDNIMVVTWYKRHLRDNPTFPDLYVYVRQLHITFDIKTKTMMRWSAVVR